MISLAKLANTSGKAFNLVDPEKVSWFDYFNLIAVNQGSTNRFINLNPHLAYVIGWVLETCFRFLKIRSRPLITRHVVLVMSRDQDYSIKKITRILPEYPIVGYKKGMEVTLSWMSEQSANRSAT
jgi:hypothetical protein